LSFAEQRSNRLLAGGAAASSFGALDDLPEGFRIAARYGLQNLRFRYPQTVANDLVGGTGCGNHATPNGKPCRFVLNSATIRQETAAETTLSNNHSEIESQSQFILAYVG